MAAVNLVSSFAGFFFLVIGTSMVVLCMYNVHCTCTRICSRRSTTSGASPCAWRTCTWTSSWRSPRARPCGWELRGWTRGELCYGHHSLDCHSRFHKLQEGSQPSWLGGIPETYLVGLFWLMLSFRVSIDSTDLTISHSIQKMNPSIWQIKLNIQKIFSDFPNKISVHGAVCVALSKLCKA